MKRISAPPATLVGHLFHRRSLTIHVHSQQILHQHSPAIAQTSLMDLWKLSARMSTKTVGIDCVTSPCRRTARRARL